MKKQFGSYIRKIRLFAFQILIIFNSSCSSTDINEDKVKHEHFFSNKSSRGLIKNSIIKEAEKIKASVDSLEIVSVDSSENFIKNKKHGKWKRALFFVNNDSLIMIKVYSDFQLFYRIEEYYLLKDDKVQIEIKDFKKRDTINYITLDIYFFVNGKLSEFDSQVNKLISKEGNDADYLLSRLKELIIYYIIKSRK
jgi:hypothetical protein